jgi:hypothetical protein
VARAMKVEEHALHDVLSEIGIADEHRDEGAKPGQQLPQQQIVGSGIAALRRGHPRAKAQLGVLFSLSHTPLGPGRLRRCAVVTRRPAAS